MEYAPVYSPSSFTSIFILHENNHATRVETFSTTRDGKVFSARLPSIKPRFESRCHMSIECNVGSRPCHTVFFCRFSPVFLFGNCNLAAESSKHFILFTFYIARKCFNSFPNQIIGDNLEHARVLR